MMGRCLASGPRNSLLRDAHGQPLHFLAVEGNASGVIGIEFDEETQVTFLAKR